MLLLLNAVPQLLILPLDLPVVFRQTVIVYLVLDQLFFALLEFFLDFLEPGVRKTRVFGQS